MYLNDLTTIPANLAGIPGISDPDGARADEDGLPTGIQLMAPAREDARLYTYGAALEQLLERAVGPHAHLAGAEPQRLRTVRRNRGSRLMAAAQN